MPLLAAIGIGAVMLLCGGCLGYVIGGVGPQSTPKAAAPASASAVPFCSANPTACAPTTAVPTTAAATTSPPPPPPPAGPKTSFGDGIWEVNVDIAPGKYKTTVPQDSINCYWERMKNTSGDFESIIANDNHGPGQPVTITIAKTDGAFKSNGCGTWTKVG